MTIVKTGRFYYRDRIKELMQKIKGKKANRYPRTVKLIEQIYRAIENHTNGYWGEYGDWYKNLSEGEDDFTCKRNREVISEKRGAVKSLFNLSNNIELEIITWYKRKAYQVKYSTNTDIWLHINEDGLIKEYFVLPEPEQKQQAADYANLINSWTIIKTARTIPKDIVEQNAIIYLLNYEELGGVIHEVYDIWNDRKLSKPDKDFYIETLVKGIAGNKIWSEDSKLESIKKLKFVFSKDRKIPLIKTAIETFISEAKVERNIEVIETKVSTPPEQELICPNLT